jgi:hypothetical protein
VETLGLFYARGIKIRDMDPNLLFPSCDYVPFLCAICGRLIGENESVASSSEFVTESGEHFPDLTFHPHCLDNWEHQAAFRTKYWKAQKLKGVPGPDEIPDFSRRGQSS